MAQGVELQYRMQFAERYPTEDEVSTAVDTFTSWTQVKRLPVGYATSPKPLHRNDIDDHDNTQCSCPTTHGGGDVGAKLQLKGQRSARFLSPSQPCRDPFPLVRNTFRVDNIVGGQYNPRILSRNYQD